MSINIDVRRLLVSGGRTGVVLGVALFLVLSGVSSFAAESAGVWVEAEGFYHLGDETTMEQAQRGSLEAARRAAIEKGVGVHVTGSTLVRNAQLVDDLVHVMSRGLIVEERILEQDLKSAGDKGSHATYRTRIKAKVVRLAGGPRTSNFSVRCRLDRSTYQHGEHAVIRITPNEDAYIYAFNVTEDEHITVLLPNRYLSETRVKSGTELVFPSQELTKRSISLTTMVVPGKTRSVESIKVIATRQPIETLKRRASEAIFEEYRPDDTTMLVDLLKTLASLDANEWAECSSSYDIVRDKLALQP